MNPENPDLKLASQAVEGLLGLADLLAFSPHTEVSRSAKAIRLLALEIDEAHGRLSRFAAPVDRALPEASGSAHSTPPG